MWAKRAVKAEEELARVRGLLQEAFDAAPDISSDWYERAEPFVKPASGAESADIGKHSCADELCDGHCDDPDCPKRKRADIGKLDTADESGVEMWAAVEMFEDDWDEPRPLWEDLPEADRNSYIKMAGAALRVFKVSQMSPKELDETLAGERGNGGEKAMRGYIFACNLGHEFGYRCAADPPEGIQCAIAGCNSAAVPVREDVEAGSREPEKLTGEEFFRGQSRENAEAWALAESSLSSPPPCVECGHTTCVKGDCEVCKEEYGGHLVRGKS
jgi:hypothetical protein